MLFPRLIIISGPPATGKTTLGRLIAKEFRLPFLSKDDIKHILFDSLGWSDREWSKKLGEASFELIFYFMEILLQTGQSFIVETAFQPAFGTQLFLSLKEKYQFADLELHCKAANDIILKRFEGRSKYGKRHPGHVDHLNSNELQKALVNNKYNLLNIGGRIIEIDTTDFTKIDYRRLFDQINRFLSS